MATSLLIKIISKVQKRIININYLVFQILKYNFKPQIKYVFDKYVYLFVKALLAVNFVPKVRLTRFIKRKQHLQNPGNFINLLLNEESCTALKVSVHKKAPLGNK